MARHPGHSDPSHPPTESLIDPPPIYIVLQQLTLPSLSIFRNAVSDASTTSASYDVRSGIPTLAKETQEKARLSGEAKESEWTEDPCTAKSEGAEVLDSLESR